jgi:tartrate dehydrogenase/decarboxylase / D-malate dehydrogenase
MEAGRMWPVGPIIRMARTNKLIRWGYGGRMKHKIALIPGDGIGQEVVPEGVRALEALALKFGFDLSFKSFPYSCQYYLDHGVMMPPDALNELKTFDVILLGAVGHPKVADHVSLWGLLLPIRRSFDQYVNLRPVKLLPGIRTPLADRKSSDIDFVVIRENTEGEYSEIGGRLYQGTDRELVVQETIFSKTGVDRILRFAFEYARKRPARHVTSATKSNGIRFTMPFWDERFKAVAEDYPEIRHDQYHIDILAAHFVMHPDWFDVVVGSNLFGDILSDLGPAVAGGIGIAPSANLNVEREYPSMFEPVHGSAPDIAGKGVANPIGTLWSVQLMLDFLGEARAAETLFNAIGSVTGRGILTRDLGGTVGTMEFTDAVLAAIAEH